MNVWSFKNVRLKSQIFTSGLGYFNRGKGSNEGFCHVGTRNSWEPLKKAKGFGAFKVHGTITDSVKK